MSENSFNGYVVCVVMDNQGEKTSFVETHCPLCQARFEFFEEEGEQRWRQIDVPTHGVLEKDKVKCYWCGANLQFNQGRLSEEISEGEIKALKDGYSVRVHFFERIMEYNPQTIKWPMFCMLCMKPVTFQDFYDVAGSRLGLGSTQLGGLSGQHTVTMKAPYCSQCRGKIKKTLPWGREEDALMIYPFPATLVQVNDEQVRKRSFGFTFRNKTYARMFREMNVKSPDEAKNFLSQPRKRFFE